MAGVEQGAKNVQAVALIAARHPLEQHSLRRCEMSLY
jgi:hypothetical protein